MKYTVQAAARAAGISVHRLRNWERRYGVPQPARSANGWRSYDDDDVALIRRMVAFVDAGLRASHAAEAALADEPAPDLPAAPAPHPAAAALALSASQLDGEGVVAALHDARDELGWADALDGAIFPALRELGVLWANGELGLAAEHFTSELVRRELLAAVAALPPTPRPADGSGAAGAVGVALLACPEDERHDLALASLWLLVASAGVPVVYLGADVPTRDLVSATRSVGPAAVCLSATATTSLGTLSRAARELIEARAPGRLFVGGAAIAADDAASLPAAVLPGSLAASAEAIVAECRASAPAPA